MAGLAASSVKRRIGASVRGAVPPGNRLMTLWFVFALMTVAAIFAVLWPLGRRTLPQSGGNEAAVYKDQLAEIDRDVAADLIGPSEAEAARVETTRRLLAAVAEHTD